MTVENTPLKLTATQRQVVEELRSKQTDNYLLGDWYLGVLYVLQNRNNPDRISQAAQSMRELLEKLPRVIEESDAVKPPEFRGMRRGIYKRWAKDRIHYDGEWNGKKVNIHFDKTLRKIDRYLELNQQPTREEKIQSALDYFDPMAYVFEPYIQKEKSEKFREIWKNFEGFAHHKAKPDEDYFLECVSAAEQMILDLLAPITAPDQQEIRAILKRPAPTAAEASSVLALLKRRGANYDFFFKHVKTAVWIPILEDQGFFRKARDVEHDGEGDMIARLWRPILYLQRVASSAPDQVVDILVALPKTDNPRVLHRICEIACKIENIELSLKLKGLVIRYANSPYDWIHHRVFIDLLNQWGKESNRSVAAALELMKIVVRFSSDPKAEEKKARRSKNLADWPTSLEPSPRLNEWNYQELLENGVRPLADREPCRVARILIDTAANMIRLSSHQEDPEEISWERLDQTDRGHPDPKATLIHALTCACEKVFEVSPESVEVLDQALRNQPSNLFNRLRQHLYALNTNKQTLPWIRKFILKHADYARVDHDYEFQLMIRKACEYFGASLLSEEERTQIFDAIQSGPPRETYVFKTGFSGEPFTEEGFQKWQRFHRRKKLLPFAHLLFGQYQSYYQELENEFGEIPLTDEDYLPFKVGRGGLVSNRSPRSPEDLAELQNEELLTYINKWEEEKEDKDDWLIRTNIEALAGEFKTVFKDTITFNEERLKFWIDNRDRIKRPVYVKAIVQAFQEHVEENHFERLDIWLEFCEWLLSHADGGSEDGVQRHENSRECPDWGSSRRAVGDFIGACLDKDVNVPFTARESLAKLLELLCNQFDWRLDSDKPLLLNQADQITEAINNTRSRALRDLVVNFGTWVRRHDSADSVPEVKSILEKRLNADTEHHLTMPERALLGLHYGDLCLLNETWAVDHKTDFFPQGDLPVWVEAFGSFLQFTHPSDLTLKILKEDYVFALDHLAELGAMKSSDMEPIDSLGQHLFDYYAWDLFPLNGKDSLLEKFYKKTTKDRQRWASLFDYVGRTLRRRKEPLEKDLKDRVVDFFDWRVKAEEPKELGEFTFWLEAECLKPEWRLDALAKLLDLSKLKARGLFIMPEALDGMLESHSAKVVECFAKMTETAGCRTYIQKDKAKSILAAGLNSEDENVRKDAVRARDNLLKRGDYDLLDFEE